METLAHGGGNGGNKIWVYTFAWNEERMLPFFFKHYLEWMGASRIFVFDNESTDATAKICDDNPKVVRRSFSSGNKHAELNHMVHIRNSAWEDAKGSADFVLIVDCDELVYHNDMPAFLTAVKDSDTGLCTATGFDMACSTFPPVGVHLPNHVRTGIQTPTYSKPCLLMPDRVRHLSFSPGAHQVRAVVEPYKARAYAGLRLLHYPRLGWEFYLERMLARRARASPRDAAYGLNNHYARDEASMRFEFDHCLHAGVDCVT